MLQRRGEVDSAGGRRQVAGSVGPLSLLADPDPLVRTVLVPASGPRGPHDDPAAAWQGLSAAGHDRADQLARELVGTPVLRVLSSPLLRCRQTVVPLAMARGLEVEPTAALAPGDDVADLAALVTSPSTPDAVLCVDEVTLERLVAHLRHDAAGSAHLMGAWTRVGWVLTLAPAQFAVLGPARARPSRRPQVHLSEPGGGG